MNEIPSHSQLARCSIAAFLGSLIRRKQSNSLRWRKTSPFTMHSEPYSIMQDPAGTEGVWVYIDNCRYVKCDSIKAAREGCERHHQATLKLYGGSI